jgi:hypothetical protein
LFHDATNREAELEERERENGEKKNCGPNNGNKLGPTHEFSPDLNPDWIQKQVKGLTQIWHGTHIKFKLGFQSSLKSFVPNIYFWCGIQ